MPVARDPAKEMAGATLIVGGVAYLTSVFYFMLPHAPKIHPGALIPRPWDLLPAAIYLVAAIGYARRLSRGVGALLDRALFFARRLNVVCHLTMSESQHRPRRPLHPRAFHDGDELRDRAWAARCSTTRNFSIR